MLTFLERALMIEMVAFSNPRGSFDAASLARINRSADTVFTASVMFGLSARNLFEGPLDNGGGTQPNLYILRLMSDAAAFST
jgi:hypothetical protein